MKVKLLTTCRNLVTSALVACLLLPSAAVAETPAESHETIRAAAEAFARDQIDVTGLTGIRIQASDLDPRLALADCQEPLETFATGNSRQLARLTVGVRCNGVKPWTLYVPVTVDAMAAVVFSSRPLLRGEALGNDALEIRRLPVARLPLNHVSEKSQLTGMETSRPLQAGVPITLNSVRPRQLVKQGQKVAIIAASGGIQVRMNGVALKNGSRGDLIPVENGSSGRRVEAEILDAGTVRVNF